MVPNSPRRTPRSTSSSASLSTRKYTPQPTRHTRASLDVAEPSRKPTCAWRGEVEDGRSSKEES
eukprot:6400051-Pyramimonas_sp.AAC.1